MILLPWHTAAKLRRITGRKRKRERQMEMSSYHRKLSEFGVPIPSWVSAEITVMGVEWIWREGYSEGWSRFPARQIMDAHGDEVIRYLEDMGDGSLSVEGVTSWAGLASDLLSMAVENWAGYVWDDVVAAVEKREAEAEAEAEDEDA